jgi:hypothetical protein
MWRPQELTTAIFWVAFRVHSTMAAAPYLSARLALVLHRRLVCLLQRRHIAHMCGLHLWQMLADWH